MSHSVLCYSSPKELRQYLILKTITQSTCLSFSPAQVLYIWNWYESLLGYASIIILCAASVCFIPFKYQTTSSIRSFLAHNVYYSILCSGQPHKYPLNCPVLVLILPFPKRKQNLSFSPCCFKNSSSVHLKYIKPNSCSQ